MPVFPSAEWVGAWVALANASEEFRLAGQGWDGAACLVVRDVPGADGLVSYIRLVGRDGCWSEHVVSTNPQLASDARMVLTAAYPVWKRLITQELGPLAGILQGQIRVEGHLPDLLKYRASIITLCVLAGRMDTQFLQ